MIYEFACHDCRITHDVERPVEQAGDMASCPVCREPMVRIFHAPAMLGRQKPRGFKWDAKTAILDGRNSVVRAFQAAEAKGAAEYAKVVKESGPQEVAAARSFLKENYA